VIVAAIIFAVIPLLGLELFLVAPLIGLVLAAGAPPDYVADAKPVDRRPRNVVLGIVVSDLRGHSGLAAAPDPLAGRVIWP
jgi:hypothetical protein